MIEIPKLFRKPEKIRQFKYKGSAVFIFLQVLSNTVFSKAATLSGELSYYRASGNLPFSLVILRFFFKCLNVFVR